MLRRVRNIMQQPLPGVKRPFPDFFRPLPTEQVSESRGGERVQAGHLDGSRERVDDSAAAVGVLSGNVAWVVHATTIGTPAGQT